MNEEWRDIRGYEGRYQISSFGRVKSLKDNKGNYREKILDLKPNKRGYIRVTLYREGKSKSFQVHRLVAIHFIPNPNNYSQVNHKDENKQNNKVDNLEWCTQKYNLNYGTRNQRISKSHKGIYHTEESKRKISKNHADFSGEKNGRARKVLCITTCKKFNTIKEAAEFYNIVNISNLTTTCKGRQKTCGKHPVTGEKLKWKYIDE